MPLAIAPVAASPGWSRSPSPPPREPIGSFIESPWFIIDCGGANSLSFFFFFLGGSSSAAALRSSGSSAGATSASFLLTSTMDVPLLVKMGSSSFSATIFFAFFSDLPPATRAATTLVSSALRSIVLPLAAFSASLRSALAFTMSR